MGIMHDHISRVSNILVDGLLVDGWGFHFDSMSVSYIYVMDIYIYARESESESQNGCNRNHQGGYE